MSENHAKTKQRKKVSKWSERIFLLVVFLLLLGLTIKYAAAAVKVKGGTDSVFTDTAAQTNPFGNPDEIKEVSGEGEQVFAPDLKIYTGEPTPEPTVEPTPVPTPERLNPVPESGTVFSRRFADQCCTLRAINNMTSDCCVVMIQEETNVTALKFFLRAGEQADILTPNGTYRFLCETGDTWISDDKYFGTRTEEFTVTTGMSLPWGAKDTLTVEEP